MRPFPKNPYQRCIQSAARPVKPLQMPRFERTSTDGSPAFEVGQPLSAAHIDRQEEDT